MSKYYTGVGSRQTPIDTCNFIQDLANRLGADGWTVRSGGAAGADHAFYSGTCMRDDARGGYWPREIYMPWRNFQGLRSDTPGLIEPYDTSAYYGLMQQAIRIAAGIHPNWAACREGAVRLHARNVFQVLGRDLQTPSRFLICWTPGGDEVGGTRTAIVLARQYDIPVFNLALPEVQRRLTAWVTRP
jgi:hypothetical protein